MEPPRASLDTSFWINAFRAGLLIRLVELFQLSVTDAVVEEIRYPARRLGAPPQDIMVLEEWLARGTIRHENPSRPLSLFGPGEAAAIALAEERDYILLMDDGRPYQYAKARGLRVVGTPDLVVVLYDGRHLTLQEARQMLRALLGVSAQIVEAAGALLEAIARAREEGR